MLTWTGDAWLFTHMGDFSPIWVIGNSMSKTLNSCIWMPKIQESYPYKFSPCLALCNPICSNFCTRHPNTHGFFYQNSAPWRSFGTILRHYVLHKSPVAVQTYQDPQISFQLSSCLKPWLSEQILLFSNYPFNGQNMAVLFPWWVPVRRRRHFQLLNEAIWGPFKRYVTRCRALNGCIGVYRAFWRVM